MADYKTSAENQGRASAAPAEIVIEFAEAPWESPAPGLRVKEVCRGNQRLRLIEFREGFTETDWCRTGHMGYVIEGTLEIDVGGRVFQAEAGDGLFIPSGESARHKARVRRGKATLFVVDAVESSVADCGSPPHRPGAIRSDNG